MVTRSLNSSLLIRSTGRKSIDIEILGRYIFHLSPLLELHNYIVPFCLIKMHMWHISSKNLLSTDLAEGLYHHHIPTCLYSYLFIVMPKGPKDI